MVATARCVCGTMLSQDVHLSVTRRYYVEMAKCITFFSLSGSHTVLVFPCQTLWQFLTDSPSRGCRMQVRYETSSSAIAQRPHNALCLSVVSFNSTERRVQFFVVSY